MCLNFPAPFILAIAKTAEESAYTMPLLSRPQYLMIFLKPSSSAEHFTRAYSSASAELRVTLLCVRDHPLRKWLPIINDPPLVDFLVVRHPARPESE